MKYFNYYIYKKKKFNNQNNKSSAHTIPTNHLPARHWPVNPKIRTRRASATKTTDRARHLSNVPPPQPLRILFAHNRQHLSVAATINTETTENPF